MSAPLVWICRLRSPNLARVQEVCEDILKQDATFRCRYGKNYIDLICSSEDEAHKKGMWFHGKVDPRILYHVFPALKEEI